MILRTSIVIFHAWWILLTPRTHVLVKFVFPIPLDTGVAQMLYNMQLCLIWHQGCLILYIIPRIWPRPILKSLRTGKQGIIPILKTTQKPADRTKENNSVQVINSCCPVQWGKNQYLSQDCILIQPPIVQAESWEKMEDWCLLASYWAIWRQFGQAKLLFRTSKRVGACYDFIYTFNDKDRNSLLLLQWVRQAYILPWKNERECHHERQKLLPHGNKGTPALSCPARGLSRFFIVRTTLIFSYCP